MLDLAGDLGGESDLGDLPLRWYQAMATYMDHHLNGYGKRLTQ